MRAAALIAVLFFPGRVVAAEDVGSLIGAVDKLGTIGLLVVGCYFLAKEVIRQRNRAHAYQNILVNCHQAREMWKSGCVQAQAHCSAKGVELDLDIQAMMTREEKLLQPLPKEVAV